LVNIVALTGGMSVDKQKRQLEKGADIVVATPGRLWDLIGEVCFLSLVSLFPVSIKLNLSPLAPSTE
jgi:superfamily II DNA/RNA helicase